MSDFVRFTKEGLISFDWDGTTRTYVPDPLPDARGQICNLRVRCEIEPGVTLGDIFKAVENQPLLVDFITCYSWCNPIREFHEQAKLPTPEPDADDKTQIVEILIEAWAEVHSARKKQKVLTEKPMRFDGVWFHFTGIGKDGIHYSLSCIPMNEIANIPVRLTETCNFRKDFEPLFDLPTEFTFSLLDVLDTIYWDISFHGGPKENAEFIDDLRGKIEELKECKAKTKPWKSLDEMEEEAATDSSQDPQK